MPSFLLAIRTIAAFSLVEYIGGENFFLFFANIISNPFSIKEVVVL